jgi:hypothetical protein
MQSIKFKTDYCAESLGKLKSFKPLCLLDDEHPEAAQNLVLLIYPARNNTEIMTQSQYTASFLRFYRPSLSYTERCITYRNIVT